MLAVGRVLKYYQPQGRMNMINKTFSNASDDLAHFLITFFIVFGAFAVIGHVSLLAPRSSLLARPTIPPPSLLLPFCPLTLILIDQVRVVRPEERRLLHDPRLFQPSV